MALSRENDVALGLVSVHPGEILAEALAERSMSQAEFAARTGLTPKHINRIIRGHNGYSPDVALRFQRVLGIGARFWLMALANHGLALALARQSIAAGDQTRSRAG